MGRIADFLGYDWGPDFSQDAIVGQLAGEEFAGLFQEACRDGRVQFPGDAHRARAFVFDIACRP